jgi:hypothetical protein
MPCGWRRNTSTNLRTNLLVIIEGNGFSKLKGFLKRDHFVYKPTQFNLTNKKGRLWSTKIQNNEKEKRPK